jgi:putative hemolysin
MDPAGHYNRPAVFRLHVDTSPRPPVIETTVIETNTAGAANSAAAISQLQGGQDEHRTSEDTHRT